MVYPHIVSVTNANVRAWPFSEALVKFFSVYSCEIANGEGVKRTERLVFNSSVLFYRLNVLHNGNGFFVLLPYYLV